MDASLRFSPLKFTKSPPERSSYLPSNKNINRLQSNRYYCHYSNALYMGGMDSFKKNGYGVMLMDSGTCAITCYSHDTPVETHIIFREKSLTIVTLNGKKTKTVTYRSGAYLLTASYNNRNFIQGIGYLIDFKQNKLYKLYFYQSKVDRKQEIKDQRILNNIFVNLQYSDIMDDPSHIQYLFMNFNISNISSVKESSSHDGDIYKIGFLSRSKKEGDGPRANGLVFKIRHNNKPDQFCFQLLERGYFEGQKLQRFGQRHYENGNYYIGGFKNDLFDGYGVLVHPQENKWTYGVYKKGQLIDIIQSSINSKFKLQQVLKKVHEDEDTYIKCYSKMIPNQSQLKLVLSNSLDQNISVQIIEDPKEQALRTLNNLKSIKDDYIKRQYQSKTQQTIIQQLGKQRSKIYKSYVEGLPVKQSSPMVYKSRSKSKSKQVNHESEADKQQENSLNYELKKSQTRKQRENSGQKQIRSPNTIKKKQKNITTPSKKNYKSTILPTSKSNQIQKQPNYQIRVTTPKTNNRQKPIGDGKVSPKIKQLILIKEQNNEEDKQKKDQISYEQKLQQIDKQIQKEKTKRNNYHDYNFNNQDPKQDSPMTTLNNTKSAVNYRQTPYHGAAHIFNRTSNNPEAVSASRPYSRYQYTDVDEPMDLKPYYPSQIHVGGCYEDPYSRQISTTVSGLPFENETDYELQRDLYKNVYQVGYLKAFSRIYPEELQKSRSKSIQLKDSKASKSGEKQKPISRRGYKYKYQTQQDEYGQYRGYLQEQLVRRRNELRDRLVTKYGFDKQ